MNSEFVLRLIVLVFFIFIIIFLAKGVYYIFRPSKDPERMAKTLTIRMLLSVTIFIVMGVAIGLGWLEPKSLLTTPKVPLESSKPGKTDQAKPHPQNANTKPQIQMRNGYLA